MYQPIEAVTLKKMAKGSVYMSENAVSELAAFRLIVGKVVELVKTDYSLDEWNALNDTEKAALIYMIQMGYFPHL